MIILIISGEDRVVTFNLILKFKCMRRGSEIGVED